MNNIHFTTNPDGGGTEGIGAMAQYHIWCYVLSQLYNTEFSFSGFKNLQHYQYFDITPTEWDQGITQFFNFPTSTPFNTSEIQFTSLQEDLEQFIINHKDLIISFHPNHLMKFADQYINEPLVQKVLKKLGTNLVLDSTHHYFDLSKKNVAIHIRKYTKTDCDLSSRREYFNESKKSYYIDLIKSLSKNNTHFHIYSQGSENDFDFLSQENVTLHIEENPIVSLYHMINSDILVTANSSFSYIAHLLGNHSECYVRDTFFHQWHNSCIKL